MNQMQPRAQRETEPAYRIYPENIPDELKDGEVWVNWVLQKVDGRITKVPYVPSRKGLVTKASTTDPSTWRSFEEALACAQLHVCGIGRVFVADGIVGIDYDAKPELSPTAKGLMDMTHSYTEWSPSGKGAHTYARGEVPDWFKGGRHGDIEMYRAERFFTVTGNRINGHAMVLRDQPLIDAAFQQVSASTKQYADVDLPATDKEPPENWREQLPADVLACLNGFGTLTGDDSADDYAVAKELLRVHPDAEWVLEALKEGAIRDDMAKYDRRSYWVPTIKRAWASLVTGFDVVEVPGEPKASATTTPTATDFVSLYDIMNGPDPDPIFFSVAEMMTTGLHIFGAAPKTGKTRFMLQTSVTVSVGGVLMGRFKCEKQKVLYYMLEDSMASLKNRLKEMGLEAPSPEDFVFKFTSPNGIAGLRADLIATGAKFCVIDTAAMFMPGDNGKVNAYERDTQLFKPLKALCDELGITLVIITHTTKATNDDNPFADIQGSLGKQGMASGMLVMRRVPRDKQRVMLHAHGRDISMNEWMLESVGDTPAWQLASEEATMGFGSAAAQAVLKCLRTHGSSRAGDIAEITGFTRQWVHQMLNRMLDAKLVTVHKHYYSVSGVVQQEEGNSGPVEW